MTTALTRPLPVPVERLNAPRPAPSRRSHLRPVPECEPPFDDVAYGGALPAPARARLHWSTTAGAPVVDWTVPGWSRETDIGVARTSTSSLPDPKKTAEVFARALIEALSGFRQVSQLSTHCSPEIFAALHPRVRPGGPLPRLLSVRASEPADGVAEASAVFRRGERSAALAFRLQGIDGRWRVTALQIG